MLGRVMYSYKPAKQEEVNKMKKKYPVLLAAALLVGAIALVPANVAGENIALEEEAGGVIEIPLSDLIPNFAFGLLGILGIALNFDLGNWFVDFGELTFGVEEFDVSVIFSILSFIEEDLIRLIIPEAFVSLMPLALSVVFEGFNIVIVSLPVERLELDLSLLQFSTFLSIDNLALISLIPEIGMIAAIFFDLLISSILVLDSEGFAVSFDVVLSLLLGLIELDILPPIDFEIEWPW